MSAHSEEKPFRFIPKTTVGKGLLGLYLISFIAVALSVTGIIFSEPRMFGPMPEVALWAYFWFGMMNVVLLGTYFYLFKPWAETALRYVEAESKAANDAQPGESEPDSNSDPVTETEDN